LLKKHVKKAEKKRLTVESIMFTGKAVFKKFIFNNYSESQFGSCKSG
jgi:hypothetical protein